MFIRYARPEDAKAMAEINNIEGWQTAYRGILPDEFLDGRDVDEAVKRTRASIEKNPYDGLVFEDNKRKILGFCLFGQMRWNEEFGEVCDCELYAIYVAQNSRGSGVGKALLKATLAEFKKRKKKSMLVNVLAKNTPSIAFYQHLGGTPIGNKDFVLDGVNYPQLTLAFEV